MFVYSKRFYLNRWEDKRKLRRFQDWDHGLEMLFIDTSNKTTAHTEKWHEACTFFCPVVKICAVDCKLLVDCGCVRLALTSESFCNVYLTLFFSLSLSTKKNFLWLSFFIWRQSRHHWQSETMSSSTTDRRRRKGNVKAHTTVNSTVTMSMKYNWINGKAWTVNTYTHIMCIWCTRFRYKAIFQRAHAIHPHSILFARLLWN